MGRKFKVFAATHGSTADLMKAVKDRINELGGDVEMSTDIMSGQSCECGQADCPICNPNGYIKSSSQQATMYSNYEEFVDTCYPEYNVEPEDMTEEILAVEDEIRNHGEDPSHCPTFWRDDYEDPIVLLNNDEFYFVNLRGNRYGLEARLTPVDVLYENYGETFGLPIEGCDSIMQNSQMGECKYMIEDSYGAPQAGVDVKYFETYDELSEYLEANPDVEERMSEGYAIIKEC